MMSLKDEWETPQWLFKLLDEEFYFLLDTCATDKNCKCAHLFTKEMNGLNQNWDIGITGHKNVFCNPPFSESAKWIKKAYEESLKGCLVVMLLMVATGTKAWQDIIFKAERNFEAEIRFLKGRIRYEIDGKPSKNSPTFDSAIVIFGKNRSGIRAMEYKNNGNN